MISAGTSCDQDGNGANSFEKPKTAGPSAAETDRMTKKFSQAQLKLSPFRSGLFYRELIE
jgi:hypothetical protein